MKRILQSLVLAGLIVGAQSAWSIVRVGSEAYPPQASSPYPSDGEWSFNLSPLDTYSDRHQDSKEQQTGDPFPVTMAKVMIDD